MIVSPLLLAASGALVSSLTRPTTASPFNGKQDHDGDQHAACNSLWESAPKHLDDLTVNLAEWVPANSTLNYTNVGSFIPVAIDVGPFCRFSGNITTSDRSSVRFEVWLPPKEQWNGHHLMVGNGGSNGFVRYDVMQVPVNKYGFAVASTNNGHDGGLTDGTYALQNPETQKDFGYRATHLTTVYSKKIVDLYYGDRPGLSYFVGCSAGGRQGMKELQDYPEDYDAALIGAPAWNWARQLGFSYYINNIVNPVNTSRFIPLSSWTSINGEILAQCDSKDGLVDGLIVRPGECVLSYDEFTCGTALGRFNSTTCLSEEQVGTLRKIFSDWTDPITGEVIFQGYEVSTAFQGGAGQTLTGRPNGSGPGYYTYYVQNVTSLVEPLLAPALTINGQPINEIQLIDLINQAESENPGGVIATDTDLSDFFGRGGKLLHYMGGADPLVPTNSSLDLFQRIGNTSPDAVGKDYQFYEIPGMAHCGGGPGTGNFGQADQVVTAAGGQYQSSQFDAQHDALLALRDWREKHQVPGPIVAAKYQGDDKREGVSRLDPEDYSQCKTLLITDRAA